MSSRLREFQYFQSLILIHLLGMDLSSASSLKVLRVENNSSLQLVVVPSVILNDDVSETSIFDSEIHISGCSSLERVSLQGSKGGNMIGKLHFADLPALDYLDVSAVEAVNTVVLTDVNPGIGSILLPSELTAFLDGTGRFYAYITDSSVYKSSQGLFIYGVL